MQIVRVSSIFASTSLKKSHIFPGTSLRRQLRLYLRALERNSCIYLCIFGVSSEIVDTKKQKLCFFIMQGVHLTVDPPKGVEVEGLRGGGTGVEGCS